MAHGLRLAGSQGIPRNRRRDMDKRQAYEGTGYAEIMGEGKRRSSPRLEGIEMPAKGLHYARDN